MTKATWLKGDRAYLVPTLPTAPAAAYRQPQVTVTTAPGGNRVEIQLPDGRRLWTYTANLTHNPHPKQPKPPPQPPHPIGVEKPTLW